ncbi:hypothetical protein RIMD111065_19020 [Aeromonas hydrophila]|nr:hypothetical protein RIMD111065_19020 [Aeromonas hydrophila]
MTDASMKIVKAHCNKCLHETKHLVVAERNNRGSEQADPNDPYAHYEISWCTTYTMLECCGCESVSLKREFYFSEWDATEVEYYPPQVSRQLPRWYEELPGEMDELLQEVYSALHADSRRLALMGARTLVDMYMNEQLGDIGGFEKKLSVLEESGLISKPNKEYLDAALDAGHAAAHRAHKARVVEVNQVIDIVENLLQNYVLKEAAKNLKAKTPSRKSKSSHAKS